MMSDELVVIFAPSATGDDDSLLRTRWIADRTLEKLHDLELQTTPLLDERATRSDLETAIRGASGLALFAHGREDAILVNGVPVLDRDNVSMMRGKWGHAFACYAGVELAGLACARGATCFVGYTAALNVEWEPEEIPEPIASLFTELVTITTRNLAIGIRGVKELRKRANEVAETIIDWCSEQPDQATVEIIAQQLVNRLQYREPDATVA